MASKPAKKKWANKIERTVDQLDRVVIDIGEEEFAAARDAIRDAIAELAEVASELEPFAEGQEY
jgi:hypothetical protein